MFYHEKLQEKHLKKQLFFWIFFITIALILALMIILYALGYRYDFKNKKIVLTSVIYISSYPQKADIYLNDKKIGTTKKIIKDILPGIYKIKLEKENFQNWEADIEILPYSLIEIAPALFYKTPQIEQEQEFDRLIHEDNRKIVFEKKNTIYWQNLNLNDQAQVLDLEQKEFLRVLEDCNSETIGFEFQNFWLIFDKDKKSSQIKKPKGEIKKAMLRKTDIYILNSQKELWRLKKDKQEKLLDKVKDFILWQDRIWAITLDNKLKEKNTNWQTIKENTIGISNVPQSNLKINSLSFCNPKITEKVFNEPSFICLYNNQGNFIFKNDSLFWLGKKIKNYTSKGKDLAWLDNEGNIYFYSSAKNATQFINRYFSAPEKISLISQDYLILQFPEEIKILEIETKQEFQIVKGRKVLRNIPLSFQNSAVIYPQKIQILKIAEVQTLWQKILQTFRK